LIAWHPAFVKLWLMTTQHYYQTYNIHHLWDLKLWSFIRTWEATNLWHIWMAFTHEIIQVPLNHAKDKVVLCTYTKNIHENGDDDHHCNWAVHNIKEVPNSSYQVKYWSYCPTSACWPGFKRFPHSSHLRHSGCQS